jgi:small subunit ribosomal protein S18
MHKSKKFGSNDNDGDRRGGGRGDRDNRDGGKRRVKKVCWFELNGIEPDYKDVKLIARYITERGKIVPRRLSGVTAKNQRRLAQAVKRARHLALVSFVSENIK